MKGQEEQVAYPFRVGRLDQEEAFAKVAPQCEYSIRVFLEVVDPRGDGDHRRGSTHKSCNHNKLGELVHFLLHYLLVDLDIAFVVAYE